MPETPYIVTKGVVLRQTETRDADKILTLLTAEQGKIPVIARGVRRRTCRFAAAAQMLAYSEWTLYKKGEWYYANEASTLELFTPLRSDLTALALGCYFAELTEGVTVDGEAAPELTRHLLNGLYALGALHKPEKLVRAAFTFRLLALAGYEPLTDACACCGRENPEDAVLDAVQGVLRCRGCPGGGSGRALALCPQALAALRHILYGDDKRLYSFSLPEPALEQLTAAAEAFAAAQLERRFQTLDYYQRLLELPAK